MPFEHFRPQTLSAFKNKVTVMSRSFGVSAFEARPTSAKRPFLGDVSRSVHTNQTNLIRLKFQIILIFKDA